MDADAVKDILNELDKLRAELLERSKQALTKIFIGFFEDHPQMKSISWKQWVPYFNDGDPCVFRVDEVFFSDSVPGEKGYDEANETVLTYDSKIEDTALDGAISAITTALHSSNDTLETLYGSYAHVVVTKDAVTVEECEAPY